MVGVAPTAWPTGDHRVEILGREQTGHRLPIAGDQKCLAGAGAIKILGNVVDEVADAHRRARARARARARPGGLPIARSVADVPAGRRDGRDGRERFVAAIGFIRFIQ